MLCAPVPEGASPEGSTMFMSPRKAADGAFLPEDFVVPTLVDVEVVVQSQVDVSLSQLLAEA